MDDPTVREGHAHLWNPTTRGPSVQAPAHACQRYLGSCQRRLGLSGHARINGAAHAKRRDGDCLDTVAPRKATQLAHCTNHPSRPESRQFRCSAESVKSGVDDGGDARGSRVRVYNAQAHSVVQSVHDGGHGFSGWVGNILPGLMGWLVEHALDDDPQVLRVQRALSVAEAALGSNYPSSAKWTLRECFGVPIQDVSRMSPNANLTPHTTQPLRDLIALLDETDLLELQP